MNTGGPAFPVPVSDATDGRTHDGGMTLLDWMAGQALVGFLVYPYGSMCDKGTSKAAYDYASAMLAEKARREATGKQDLQVQDHSGDANKMVPDHSPDARKLVERQNAQLRSLLRQAELAIAFANREPNVIRMLGDDYTEVLQLVRAALQEEKP